MNGKEIKRIVETEITLLLQEIGGLLIEGPKLCGKTFLGQKYSQSQFYVENYGPNLTLALQENWQTNIIFSGLQPRLIDEWQILPQIWDRVRFLIDQAQGKPGQYILTGSSRAKEGSHFHSGAGRIYRLKMHTLTFSEILSSEQEAKISLRALFANQIIKPIENHYQIDWIIKQLLDGGWPGVLANKQNSQKIIKSYLDGLSANLINNQNLRLDANVVQLILKSLARLNTTQMKQSTILKDINYVIDGATLSKYLYYFKDLFLIFEIPIWLPAARFVSKTKMRTTAKTYFCDPSIGLYLLNINQAEQFYKDPQTLGIYFENQVIKDLLVYVQALDGQLYFYRDANGLEIDAIIELNNGQWAAIEIKLGAQPNQLELASKNLKRFACKMASATKQSQASFLMIITAGGLLNQPYQQSDDIYVIPHTCLGI